LQKQRTAAWTDLEARGGNFEMRSGKCGEEAAGGCGAWCEGCGRGGESEGDDALLPMTSRQVFQTKECARRTDFWLKYTVQRAGYHN
jgi:hypothetical protein